MPLKILNISMDLKDSRVFFKILSNFKRFQKFKSILKGISTDSMGLYSFLVEFRGSGQISEVFKKIRKDFTRLDGICMFYIFHVSKIVNPFIYHFKNCMPHSSTIFQNLCCY